MSMSPFFTVDQPCDSALQWANERLGRVGLQTVQTFDLHTARASSHECLCPHHGTEQCDCQMVVLLVYGSANEPETLILHGSDGKTWLSLANSMQHSTGLANDIRKVLEF